MVVWDSEETQADRLGSNSKTWLGFELWRWEAPPFGGGNGSWGLPTQLGCQLILCQAFQLLRAWSGALSHFQKL